MPCPSDEHRHEEGVGHGGGHVPPPTRHAPQSGHRDQYRQVGEYPPRQQRPPGLSNGRHREYARALQRAPPPGDAPEARALAVRAPSGRCGPESDRDSRGTSPGRSFFRAVPTPALDESRTNKVSFFGIIKPLGNYYIHPRAMEPSLHNATKCVQLLLSSFTGAIANATDYFPSFTDNEKLKYTDWVNARSSAYPRHA